MATAKLSMELTDVLSCPICMETFTRPIVLPCIHTFCTHCITNYVKTKTTEAEGGIGGEDMIFPCPTCRRDTTIPKGGVSCFPPNVFINNLNDVYVSMTQINDLCELCSHEAESNSAIWRCIDCNQSMCDACKSAHQRMVRVIGNHTIVSLEKWKNTDIAEVCVQNKEWCLKHPSEVLKFYCCICEKGICRDCHVLDHVDHKCRDIGDVAKEMKERMKQYMAQIKSNIEKRGCVLKEIDDKKCELIDKEKDTVNDIRVHKDKYIGMISEYFDELENVVRTTQAASLKFLDLTSEGLQIENTSLKNTYDLGLSLVNYGRNSEILDTTERLSNIVTSLNVPDVTDKGIPKIMVFEARDSGEMRIPEICGTLGVCDVFGSHKTSHEEPNAHETSETENSKEQKVEKEEQGTNSTGVGPGSLETKDGKFMDQLTGFVETLRVCGQAKTPYPPHSISVLANNKIYINDFRMNIHWYNVKKHEWEVLNDPDDDDVSTWCPSFLTSNNNSLVVVNSAAFEDDGGVYTYSHRKKKFSKDISLGNVVTATMTTPGKIAICRHFGVQRWKHIVKMYNMGDGKLCPGFSSHILKHPPRHMAYNPVSGDVIITSCGGVTALKSSLHYERWHFDDCKDTQGVCVDPNGTVIVADYQRLLFLSDRGEYMTHFDVNMLLGGNLQGIAYTKDSGVVCLTENKCLYDLIYRA